MNTRPTPVTGVSTIGASGGLVEEQVIVIGDSKGIKISFIGPDDVIKFLLARVILFLAILADVLTNLWANTPSMASAKLKGSIPMSSSRVTVSGALLV